MAAPADMYGSLIYSHGPTAYWRFDGDGTDVMGGAAMTLVGSPSYTTTLVSTYPAAQCLDFFTSKYTTTPDANQFDYTYNFSIEAWWQADAMAADGHFISKYHWGIGHVGGATPRFYHYDDVTVTNCSGSAMSNGVTYHVVGTYDGANMKLYMNGALDHTTAFTATFPVNTKPLLVASWDTLGGYVDGRIDEVAVYGRALSAAEVSQHYLAGLGQGLPIITQPPRRP